MLIYKDLFSEDELCSDTYPLVVLDGVVICVTGKYTTEKTDMGGINIGANASEEDPQEEGGEAAGVSGVDVVLANRLIETGFKKKDYMIHIKGYIARILAKLKDAGKHSDEEIDMIKKGLGKQVKEILGEFKDYQFFMGESADEDGMMIPVKYAEDGTTPKLYFFKHGLIEEKV